MVNQKRVTQYGIEIITILLLTTRCGPSIYSYKHLCVKASTDLIIINKSTISTDSQGKSLKLAKIGLPLEARLEKHDYVIKIYTPLANVPIVHLVAQTHSKENLILAGPYIQKYDPSIFDKNNNVHYQYGFIVGMANGNPIKLSVFNNKGECLGVEIINYKIITRGYAIGVEAI
jgi:hypothetical protein